MLKNCQKLLEVWSWRAAQSMSYYWLLYPSKVYIVISNLIVFGTRMSVTEERIQELNRRFLDFMSKTENVETATKEIYEDLLDEVLMGFVFDVHRTTKTGSSDIEEGIPDDESYAIVGMSKYN